MYPCCVVGGNYLRKEEGIHNTHTYTLHIPTQHTVQCVGVRCNVVSRINTCVE